MAPLKKRLNHSVQATSLQLRIPLTQATLNEKKTELQRLTALRAEVVKRLATAREMGDLSENGAYTAAKFELGNVGRQLRAVKHLLTNAYVPAAAPTTAAAFVHTITLTQNGKLLTFMLVSKYESNPQQHKLSQESPLGNAVLGKKVGDTIRVVTPRGVMHYTITDIRDSSDHSPTPG